VTSVNTACQSSCPVRAGASLLPEAVWVWGLPLVPLTLRQTVDIVDRLIDAATPSYFITANLHYAMLSAGDARLREVNSRAAFLVADGMPLVWASRNARLRDSTRKPVRLPERVTGADLVPALCERAAQVGRRVYLLGGGPGVAAAASHNLCTRYPGLQVVGAEAPPFRPATAAEHAALTARIQVARPDILFVALGQPKGELWLAEHYQSLGVPVSVQIGAALDFAAGRVPRAPRWAQRLGLEWAFRLVREPGRLATRYAANLGFLIEMFLRDLLARPRTVARDPVPGQQVGS
jgi:N-acetylglucosaminyldiphosphoundecaprenol N-acetyl-beta-D-mannosaminyltransferase